MAWDRQFRLREHLRTALWPVPCAMGMAALALGMGAWRVDAWLRWSVLGFEHAGATALAAAIVGATLTFLGTAFSVLLVVVQFASTQLTPRAIHVSLSDPLYRFSVGLFVATFVVAMTILARTNASFVPQLGLLVAILLAVASLVAYIVLISHMRRSLRPVIVAARVGARGRRTLARIYREPFEARRDGGAAPLARATDNGRGLAGAARRVVEHVGRPGILVAFDADGLVSEARRVDGEIALVPAVGDFVRTGAALFELREPSARMNAERLRRSVALGPERALAHDPAFALRILVDVALKALSPSINDPTSAVMAIDQLHDLLAFIGGRRLDIERHCDAAGRVRLLAEAPTWEDYVSLAVDEVRAAGAQVQVLRRLRAMLEDLGRVVPEARRAAVERELALLGHAVQRAFADPEDRARASEADAQGIGSSPRSPRA